MEEKVAVRVIRQKGQAVLVEYREEGRLVRCTLPAPAQEAYTREELAAGIPYGVDWSAVVLRQPTGEELAEALRNAGVWTGQEALANPQVVVGVVQALYGVDAATILKLAREEARRQGE